MTYTVKLAPVSVEQIKKMNAEIQQQIVRKLEELAQNPLLAQAHKLKNQEDLYLFRLNNQYRIVYQLNNNFQLIVLKVAQPSDY